MSKKIIETTRKTNVPDTKIYGLLKFGSEKRIKDLYENGTFFVNSILEFNKSDKEDHRYDSYEGGSYLINSFPGTVPIDVGNGNIIELKFIKAHVKEKPKPLVGNISSFFGVITEMINEKGNLKIDDKMKDFGEQVILIHNYPKFMGLIRNAMDKIKVDYEYGLVEYYDEHSYSGKLTPFHKRNSYQYQTEFRIHFKTGLTTSMTLNLGSLKDVAVIGPSKGIENLKIIPS